MLLNSLPWAVWQPLHLVTRMLERILLLLLWWMLRWLPQLAFARWVEFHLGCWKHTLEISMNSATWTWINFILMINLRLSPTVLKVSKDQWTYLELLEASWSSTVVVVWCPQLQVCRRTTVDGTKEFDYHVEKRWVQQHWDWSVFEMSLTCPWCSHSWALFC